MPDTATNAPNRHRRSASGKASSGRARSGAGDLTQAGAMGKAFSILELISESRQPLTMADIVRASGMTKPTAHRIATMLSDMGFIERDALQRGYIEGPRLISLALSTLTAAAPRNMRHAILRAVSESTGETCNFGILMGSEVIYLDRVETKWPLGLRFEAGSRLPAHCTAIGKLLLALTPDDQRRTLVNSLPLTRYTSRTITDVRRLEQNLAEIAEADVSTDDQEFIEGVVCVSIPVRTSAGRVVGSIAVQAPEARMTLDELKRFVPQMREAAVQLGRTFD